MIVRPTTINKIVESGRNDQVARKSGNRLEQVILQDQEGVLAWVSERLAVAMRQAEDLILRDYIVSAASDINASGGSNNDKMVVVVKSLIIDLEFLAA